VTTLERFDQDMILPTIIVPEKINAELQYLWPDTPEECVDKRHFDKNHFDSFPDSVSYQFNSRGFRDQEWPSDLVNAVWFAGDSVVLGIGQALENTLPVQVQTATGRTTINLGIRGVSNHTTAYVAQQLLTEIEPVNLVVFWSFFQQRPIVNNYDFLVEKSSDTICRNDVENLSYFKSLIDQLPKNTKTNVIHVFCPDISMFTQETAQSIWNDIKDPSWPAEFTDLDSLPLEIVKEISYVHKVYDFFDTVTKWDKLKKSLGNVVDNIVIKDRARDGFHWGVQTHNEIVKEIVKLLK